MIADSEAKPLPVIPKISFPRLLNWLLHRHEWQMYDATDCGYNESCPCGAMREVVVDGG